ncbi:MAG: hypothetical protein K9I26_04790 [Flavobacterium sp.]|nr:hypothetical protein [Flavobacterium sp.]
METCKKCDIKFNGTNCPICGKKKSTGGILEGILLVTAIIFATLLISMVGGVFAVIIYLLFYNSINEKYKLLLANTCLVLGIIMGTVIFKYTEKLPVEYDTYKFVGIGILAVMGYYSYKFMYKSALNNSNGLWSNVENIVTTKSYTGKTKEFLNALENDKEYQDAKQGLKEAVERLELNDGKYEEAKNASEKEYKDYADEYGKKEADKLKAKSLKYWKTKSGW